MYNDSDVHKEILHLYEQAMKASEAEDPVQKKIA